MKGFRVWGLATSKILAFLFVLFLFLYPNPYTLTPSFAAQDLIGQARIDASSPFYFLKSVREIIELKFAPSTHVKAIRYLEFATRRIREVKSLASSGHEDLIPPTLEKYWSNLTVLKGLINLKEERAVTEITGVLAVHLDNLQNTYNQVSNPRAKMSIRTTVYRLTSWNEELIEKIDLLHPGLVGELKRQTLKGCNLLQKEATSSALNDTEKLVLNKRATECFKTVEFDKRLQVD